MILQFISRGDRKGSSGAAIFLCERCEKLLNSDKKVQECDAREA
jgi:hypothetical protein